MSSAHKELLSSAQGPVITPHINVPKAHFLKEGSSHRETFAQFLESQLHSDSKNFNIHHTKNAKPSRVSYGDIVGSLLPNF